MPYDKLSYTCLGDEIVVLGNTPARCLNKWDLLSFKLTQTVFEPFLPHETKNTLMDVYLFCYKLTNDFLAPVGLDIIQLKENRIIFTYTTYSQSLQVWSKVFQTCLSHHHHLSSVSPQELPQRECFPGLKAYVAASVMSECRPGGWREHNVFCLSGIGRVSAAGGQISVKALLPLWESGLLSKLMWTSNAPAQLVSFPLARDSWTLSDRWTVFVTLRSES